MLRSEGYKVQEEKFHFKTKLQKLGFKIICKRKRDRGGGLSHPMYGCLLFCSEVELLGEHGGEAGHLLLPDGAAVGGVAHAAQGHLPVHQGQQLRELQGVAEAPQGLAQVLDVPGAVDRLPVGVVP